MGNNGAETGLAAWIALECQPQKLYYQPINHWKKYMQFFPDLLPLSKNLGCVIFLGPFPLKRVCFEGNIAHMLLIHVSCKMLLGNIYPRSKTTSICLCF